MVIRSEPVLISVMSGKGGTGKTVISACISIYLAKQNKKTVVVDADCIFSDLDVALGIEGEFTYNSFDILLERCEFEDALHKVYEDKELYFLPSSRQDNVFDFNEIAFIEILRKVKSNFDYVIVDCPTNKEIAKKLQAVSDMIIVITCPDVLSVRNSDSLISILEDENADIRLLINKFNNNEKFSELFMTPDKILDELGIKLIGVVPESKEFIKMINSSGLSLFESETTLSCVFENISKRIMGENAPLANFEEKPKTKKMKLFNKR